MLENINWILPEVFIAITATVLLGYGTILSKLGSQVSQLTKINWLTIVTLLFSAVLLIEQLGFVSSNQVRGVGRDFRFLFSELFAVHQSWRAINAI